MSYATKATILRIVSAAKAAGINVAGVRAEADGSVIVFEQSAAPMDDFDKWKAEQP
jgi:hypothetical protein